MENYLIGDACRAMQLPASAVRRAIVRQPGLPGVVKAGQYYSFDPRRLAELRAALLAAGVAPQRTLPVLPVLPEAAANGH